MKKTISILLVLTTLLACFVLHVSAAEPVVSDEARLPFEDIKEGAWYIQDLVFCYVNDVINGMNEYTFSPGSALTRAQFVTMLAKIEGADTKNYSTSQFADVKSSHWYYGAVSWAYEVGLVSGTAADKFSPNATVTRETVSRIMWLYMKDKYTVEVSDNVLFKFTDKDKISAWAEDGMKYMVASGLISGMSETTLAPRSNLTRAQAARILSVFMQGYLYGECKHSFYEPFCTTSALCMKCGMVKGLPAGHVLDAYDCVTAGKCNVCKNDVEPSKLVHDFTPATCVASRTCRDCGATRGKAKGHVWKEATCTVAKTCTVCKAIEGKALGHTTNNGICKICSSEVFKSEMHRIGYYMVNNGVADGNGHYIYDGLFEHQGSDTGYGAIYYDANNGSYVFAYSYLWSGSGANIAIAVDVARSEANYNIAVVEYHEDNKVICSAKLLFKHYEIKNGGVAVELSEYKGNSTDKAWFASVSNSTLENCLKSADYLLDDLCGAGVDEFNFKNISY